MKTTLQACLVFILTGCFFLSLSHSDIYRFVDEKGIVHYSDYPKHSGYRLYMKTEEGKERGDSFSPDRSWLVKYAERVAVREGVDPNLVRAVMVAESQLRHQAVSAKGAVGVMQLLPSSFPGVSREDLLDPVRNVSLGVKHLKRLLDKFGGDVRLAVAAYNAGEGAVEKYGGIPPFDETRAYVERVMTLYVKYRSGR